MRTKKMPWDHITSLEEVHLKVLKHAASGKEKDKLLEVVYETYDLRILDTVLTHLPKDKHHYFLENFHKESEHLRLWEWLKKEVLDIEEKIKTAAQEIKKEIIAELK